MSELIKYHHSPIWKVEETERWLREMEESGWRLVKVSRFGWKYHFKQSKPKSVQYFFGTYDIGNNARILTTCMLAFHSILQTVHLANEIPVSRFTPMWLYRITKDSDLTFEKEMRLLLLRNQAIENLIFSLSFCVLFSLYLISAYAYLPLLFWITLPICLILHGSWIGYSIFGVVKTARKFREFKKRNRRK